VERDGAKPFIRVNRFIRVDDDGADVERSSFTRDGEPIDEPEVDPSTWLEFQGHASFPEATTEVARDRIEIPLGTLDCIRYTSRDGPSVDTFWFWEGAPGQPVMYVTEEDGRFVSRVTMIEDSVVPPAS